MTDASSWSNEQVLAHAKQLAMDIREALVGEVAAASFTLKSKLPYKAAVLREALMHRMSDIVDIALDLYDADRRVSAFIQTRAAIETMALLFGWRSNVPTS
jgi:hypothetical protein